MPKSKKQRDKKEISQPPVNTKSEKQPSSAIKVAIVTTLITAIVGLLGTISTVYIQDVYRLSALAKLTPTANVSTQTIEVAFEQMNLFSQTQTEVALALQGVCPPPLDQGPTARAILTEYVNVDQADVYAEKDLSTKPFQTLVRCDSVEILDYEDYVWACVTYSRDGNVRIYGYVLRDQLILGYELTQTATP